MANEKSVGKIEWKWVRIPVELYRDIEIHARREKIAFWKVIQRAFSYWKSAQRNHHATVSDVERKSWYVFKLASSVGELKANPTEKNFELLRKTCDQISSRLGVDTSKIVLAAQQYLKDPSNKNRMLINDCTKEIIAQIISL